MEKDVIVSWLMNLLFLFCALYATLFTEFGYYIFYTDTYHISKAITVYGLLGIFGSLINSLTLVRHSRILCPTLGALGTVVGFIYALTAVNPDTIRDFSQLTPMVAQFMHGTQIALNTTLLGLIFYIWLTINLRLRFKYDE